MPDLISLTYERVTGLLIILNAYLQDLAAIIAQSHDDAEVAMYREHQAVVREWIKYLSQLRQGGSAGAQ